MRKGDPFTGNDGFSSLTSVQKKDQSGRWCESPSKKKKQRDIHAHIHAHMHAHRENLFAHEGISEAYYI